MIEFKDLTRSEKFMIFEDARSFMEKHKEHVAHISTNQKPIAPSGSDMFRPELWKGIHWAWFAKMSGLKATPSPSSEPTAKSFTDKIFDFLTNYKGTSH